MVSSSISGVVDKKLRGSRVGLETMRGLLDERVIPKFTCIEFFFFEPSPHPPPPPYNAKAPIFYPHPQKLKALFQTVD